MVLDFATRYPATEALRTVDAMSVAEALLKLCGWDFILKLCRTEVPFCYLR